MRKLLSQVEEDNKTKAERAKELLGKVPDAPDNRSVRLRVERFCVISCVISHAIHAADPSFIRAPRNIAHFISTNIAAKIPMPPGMRTKRMAFISTRLPERCPCRIQRRFTVFGFFIC